MEAVAVESKSLYNPLISEIQKVETLTALEKKFKIHLPDNLSLIIRFW